MVHVGAFAGSSMVKTASNAGGVSLIPCEGTKDPTCCVVWQKKFFLINERLHVELHGK